MLYNDSQDIFCINFSDLLKWQEWNNLSDNLISAQQNNNLTESLHLFSSTILWLLSHGLL